MKVTIEGSINPSTVLPRGERLTVERTPYIDKLLQGGYVALVAEHIEPEPVLSETQRQAMEVNAAQAEDEPELPAEDEPEAAPVKRRRSKTVED